jgi:hypothetical protein
MSHQTINDTSTQNMRSLESSNGGENKQSSPTSGQKQSEPDEGGIQLNIGSSDDGIITYDNINTHYSNHPIKDLICVKSWLEHDGYDRYGPKSNLYTIEIAYKKPDSEDVIVDKWRAEYWYYEEEVSFDLYSKIYSKEDFEIYNKEELTNDSMSFRPHIYDLTSVDDTYFIESWNQIN